tara:strand:- start:3044 stop:3808 length:765 start_codon:yes stop_codon:yes gene_type:complete
MLEKFYKPLVNVSLTRVGSKQDGGYYLPNKIIKTSKKIISCGLGSDWSFEKNLQKKNKNIKIVFYDHSINFIFWVKSTISYIYFFVRYRSNIKNVMIFFNYIEFFKHKNIKHEKLKVTKVNNLKKKEISLNQILKTELNDLILKIDIEGDEYFVLEDIVKHQKKINCLIIEFHNIDKNKKKIKTFLKSIEHLKNCNISPNNSVAADENGDPLVVEIVFINKKFLIKKDFRKNIIPKYSSNNPYKKKIIINFKKD